MTWETDAACRGHDTAMFYSDAPADIGRALRLCAACPVGDHCEADGAQVEHPGIRNGEPPRPTIAWRVIATMLAADRPLTGIEIAQRTGLAPDNTQHSIKALQHRGDITATGWQPIPGGRTRIYELAERSA